MRIERDREWAEWLRGDSLDMPPTSPHDDKYYIEVEGVEYRLLEIAINRNVDTITLTLRRKDSED